MKLSDFLWYFVPIISVVDSLLKNVILYFHHFIDFSDGKKYWINWFNNFGTFGLLMEFCPSYMSLKYLQNSFKGIYNHFYLVIRMAKSYWIDSIISKSRNWLLIKFCPTFLVNPLVTSLNYLALSNRMKLLDSRNYWMDLMIFEFLAVLCEFVPATCFWSNLKINLKQYATNFDQSFG